MAVAFVQKANSGTPSGTATSKTATFSLAQIAGDTNFVVIQYGNNAGATISQTVSSVTDSAGNIYTASPVGFITMQTTTPFAQGCVVYACPSIVAYGTGNVVTVTLAGGLAAFFAISVLEYSGVGSADVHSSGTHNGNSAPSTADSGSATTTAANDLLLGAFSLFDGPSSGGSGYTVRDQFYTFVVEDNLTTASGIFINATAISSGGSGWTAQMLAYKASTGTGPQTIVPTGIASTANVGTPSITGGIHVGFVQKANSGAAVSATNCSATFGLAQSAGHANFVVIQYGSSSSTTISQTVSSVVDSAGNTYTASPVGFIAMSTTSSAPESQGCVVYYCPNIAAYGVGNQVTVTLSGVAYYYVVSVLEYGGLATSGIFDVTAHATANYPGASSTANSGPATTTNANDILLGVFSLFDGVVGPGSGYIAQENNYTCLVEDQTVATTASYGATATTGSQGNGWTAQLLALKIAAPVSQTIAPTGIASTAAFGTLTLTLQGAIQPSGIASTARFGTLMIVPGAVTVSPTGIASTLVFGTPLLTAPVTLIIAPTGIASTAAFGTPVVLTNVIFPAGIASMAALGTPSLTLIKFGPPNLEGLHLVPPYCGQQQQSQIQVPRRIQYQSAQYSPEEGPWVMLPYSQVFNYNSQAEAQSPAQVPPPVKQIDIWLAMQTWPL